jgi:hypothetical protein
MTDETRKIKTCFVAAPSGIPLDVLRDSLLAHDIRPLVPEDLFAGTDWASEIQRQVRDADLVIGIMPAGRQSPWVLFELGQAWALGRRILLIAPPNSDKIPYSLQRFLILRIEPNNREAIDFALDQLLSAPPETPTKESFKRFTSTGLGDGVVSRLLSRLNLASGSGTEQELEKIVSEALRLSGTDIVVESPQRHRGADLAVWSDVLEPFVGNPLLIEIKRKITDKKLAARTFKKLQSYLAASDTKWGMLLYLDGPPPDDPLWHACPQNILWMPMRQLLEALRNRAFPEIVRDLRNHRVHSVRP